MKERVQYNWISERQDLESPEDREFQFLWVFWQNIDFNQGMQLSEIEIREDDYEVFNQLIQCDFNDPNWV